jgi:hypothetical protein
VEFGGPEELAVADIARAWVTAREAGGHVVSTPVPGRLSTAFRDGAALPTSGAETGSGHAASGNRRCGVGPAA